MLYNFIRTLLKGEKAGQNPWGGATLEWQTSTPPPLENFVKIPKVKKDPYDFKGVAAK
jgi:cytochrome c oxidase subunit 1